MSDHRCVGYEGEDQLSAAVLEFVAEEPTSSQQIGYFGWGALEQLLDGSPALADAETLGAGGTRVTSLDQYFRRDVAPEPATLLAFWQEATEAALDAGFTSLRAVADTTPWLREPAQRAVTLRGEHLVDRYRLDHPFKLLCVCDAALLSAEALAEITCIHPDVEGTSAPFHLHATIDADLAMSGEIDAFSVPLLDHILKVIDVGDSAHELVINAANVSFIDHQTLFAFERYAESRNVPAVILRAALPSMKHVAAMLSLRRVRVEVSQ